MRSPSIYKIVNKLNGKYYVGSSINPTRRWKYHTTDLKNNKHHNDHLQNAWNKYGESTFDFSVIEQFSSDISNSQLLIEEQRWLDIASNDALAYNLTFIAECPNLKLSVYSRKKRSESLKKVIKTEEWKQKISKSHIGIRPTITTLQKMSLAKKGKKQSDSQREACTEGRRHRWNFISPNGEKIHIYDLKRFCKENKLHSGCMYEVASLKRKSHKGWSTEESIKIKKKEKMAWTKNYIFLSPENKVIYISNLKQFCRANNLHSGNMYDVYLEKRNSHKGWIKYALPQS